MVQRGREPDHCRPFGLWRTHCSRGLGSCCCSSCPALASRVAAKTLVRDAVRCDARASSTNRDHHRAAGAIRVMLLRLLSLIDPLAAGPPQREVKSGEDSTVKPSIQRNRGFTRRQKSSTSPQNVPLG